MRGWRPILTSVALALVLVGCETPPPLYDRGQADTIQNAANLYISAYPPIPWTEISDKLSPSNNLTIAEARTLAAQTTQAQVRQFLSTFAAGLGIGLPLRAKQITTTFGADGEETTGTRSRGTGTVPSSSGVPSATIGDDALAADLAKGLANVPVDGSTLLIAGTALFQQAQILDHQIGKGLLPKGYDAYLVTFQVNLQPRRRNLSYDAYINVNLMPGNWQEALDTSKTVSQSVAALPPIMVYPLVITDAMETASVSGSVEAIRQAALQLSGVVGNVGVNAGLAGGSDRLESVVGLDKNSLITVGRVSDHTLRIRLGAQYSGSSGTAMVPRSYNVSAVVLTRASRPARVSKLSIVTEMSLISTETGEELGGGASRRPSELAKRVQRLVNRYELGPITCNIGGNEIAEPPRPQGLVGVFVDPHREDRKKWENRQMERALHLLRAVDRSDYNAVADCLGALSGGVNIHKELTLRRLISDLIEVQIDSRFSKLIIALSEPIQLQPPNQQHVVLMSDDGKSGASVILRGGKGFARKDVNAELILKDGKKLAPSSLDIQGDGREIRIAFPSLTQLPDPVELADEPLRLWLVHDEPSEAQGKPPERHDRPREEWLYKVARVVRAQDPAKNPVQALHTVLIADSGGRAQATLSIGKFPEGTKGQLYLRVSGADLREDKANGAVSPSAKGAPITAEKTVTLALGNLTPAKAVSIATVDDKGSTIGEPLVFTVDRVSAAK